MRLLIILIFLLGIARRADAQFPTDVQPGTRVSREFIGRKCEVDLQDLLRR